jgi:cytochrome b involved in lipid metabolism
MEVLLKGLFIVLALWLVLQRALASRAHRQRQGRYANVELSTVSTVSAKTQSLTKTQTEVGAAPRRFTAAEVSQHCTRDSLWLIIDGRVYDVTTYVDQHPGGDAIFRNAGRDSSAGFHGDQHPDKVNELLPDFYLGDLIE